MTALTLPPDWADALGHPFANPAYAPLQAFVADAYRTDTVYPPEADILRAFALCPFDAVRVVILGQDPYHGPGQAHGLAFSVQKGCPIPPSLRNIYREIEADLGIAPPPDGDLSRWARQGVLLLNTVLTVAAGAAGSHRGRGWEPFTSRVIAALNGEREGLVFLLWGRDAQKKGADIDPDRHLVLTAGHPSPLSIRHFRGCRHFSRCNAWLRERGQDGIAW